MSNNQHPTETKEPVRIENGFVILYDDIHDNDYDIALSRIKTERDLVAWVYHLTPKNWVDTMMLRRFIATVAEVKGWTLST